MKHLFRILLEILTWCTAVLYALGGVHIHGKLKFGYLTDLFVVITLVYVLARLSTKLRLRDLTLGKGLHEIGELINARILKRPKSLPGVFLLALTGISFLLFLFLPLLNHWAFGTHLWDLGIIENAVFNASKTGKFTTFALSDGLHPLSYVPNNRLNLGLIPFAFIYRFAPHAEILLFCQSLALISSLIPLYLLGQKILPKEIPTWFALLPFLFWDPVYRLNIWDFHEQPFIIPLCLWGFYFIESKRPAKALLFMTLMALWREDAWWTFSAMAIYLGIRTRRWNYALPAATVGFLIFPMHVALLNHVNQLGDRYPYLGANFSTAAHTLLKQPGLLFHVAWENRGFFLQLFVRTGGGLFLLGGWSILPVLPTLGEVALAKGSMLNWNNHYIGNFTGPLLFATLQGWRKLSHLLKSNPEKTRTLIAISLALCFSRLSFNLVSSTKLAFQGISNTRCMSELLAHVPSQIPVLADDPFLSHLTHREWIMPPNCALDQSRAEALISGDRATLQCGLRSTQPGGAAPSPWVVVEEKCGYFIAMRKR